MTDALTEKGVLWEEVTVQHQCSVHGHLPVTSEELIRAISVSLLLASLSSRSQVLVYTHHLCVLL